MDGRLDLKASPWFSLESLEDEWPWVFAKSRKSSLVISTLEALAVLVGLKLTVRRSAQNFTDEGRDSPDAHRQPRERCTSEQANDDEISRVRSVHGTRNLHEEDEPADGCRVGAKRSEPRARQVGKRAVR